jgi:hypothetical protein
VRYLTWQSTEVLPARLIVAMPPFLIRNAVPSFAKRWLVSEKRLGSRIDLPSNCRNAALVCGWNATSKIAPSLHS